jgi:hypothetical protein
MSTSFAVLLKAFSTSPFKCADPTRSERLGSDCATLSAPPTPGNHGCGPHRRLPGFTLRQYHTAARYNHTGALHNRPYDCYATIPGRAANPSTGINAGGHPEFHLGCYRVAGIHGITHSDSPTHLPDAHIIRSR